MTSNTLKVEGRQLSHCTTPSERDIKLTTVKRGCLNINPSTTMTSNTLKVEGRQLSHCTTPSERDINLTTVKVGCLNINPSTTRGRRMFLIQMLVLCFVPHAALVLQNCTIMAQLSFTLDFSLYLHTEVEDTLTTGELIFSMQNERQAVASFILNDVNNITLSTLKEIFLSTDELIKSTRMAFLLEDKYKTVLRSSTKLLSKMKIYEEINKKLFVHVLKHIKCTVSYLWRQLSAYYEYLKSTEEISLATSFYSTRGAHKFLESGLERLESAELYLKLANDDSNLLNKALFCYKNTELSSSKYKGNKRNGTSEDMLKADFIYSNCYSILREAKVDLQQIIRESVKKEVWAARRTLALGVLILSVVVLVAPVLVLLLRHTVATIQSFTKSIELSSQRLITEKQKSDLLLSRMLPGPVVRRLRAQKEVPAEAFDAVTIFFSDIVGFTNISATSTPMDVINMLNMLYRLFDEKIMHYDVYKVETIGDAYMVASGLPQRNGNRHASEIADMSISLLRSLDGARVPHLVNESLMIRVGVNTGPCVAGVVGVTMPRYCLFGDTINTASRMESTGEAMKIHISSTTKTALDEIGGYDIQPRGDIEVPGKGSMETFWLLDKVGGVPPESPRKMRLRDYGQNLLELIINN